MTYIWKLAGGLALLSLMNLVFLEALLKLEYWQIIPTALALLIVYVVYLILPTRRAAGLSRRLSIMRGGHRLIISASLCFGAEIFLYIAVYGFSGIDVGWKMGAANGILAAALIFFMLFIGFARIVFTSTQLGIFNRFLLLFTWWIPLWNIFLFVKACRLVKGEYRYELSKAETNEGRKENEVCRTKYPVLLVHGIFFRDWQFLNYWGRIPRELTRNGAVVYYGGQQSAAPVEQSAKELASRIEEIVSSEGCGKVNIIAHSKGGLDARYAVSCLGMDRYVASLTTINTPHRGCVFAERLLLLFPAGMVRFISGRYNGVFRKLGDKNPDFLGGVTDLTAKRCREFNESAQNSELVLYQSAASKMRGMMSAGFPLFATYPLVRIFDGPNDGLVTPESARWGTFLGIVTGSGRRGVSHGDMVDLMRENIPGFDVTEFYVNILKGLKGKGL